MANQFISDLHWVRRSQQTRSQKTQDALLNAAGELFAQNGIEATSVADVAAAAGCSVGAVYHHFKDKQTLLYALFDRYVEETVATMEVALDPNRWQGANVSDILHGYLTFSLSDGKQRAHLKKTCEEAAQSNVDMAGQLQRVHRELYTGLLTLILERQDEIGHPDPELAIQFALDQLSAWVRARMGAGPHRLLLEDKSDSVLIAEAMSLTCCYLQIEPIEEIHVEANRSSQR